MAFPDPKSLVHVAVPIDAIRSTMVKALNDRGFQRTATMGKIRHILDHLLSGQPCPDWIITTVNAQEEVNVFHLLEILMRNPSFRRCRVSLIVEAEEQTCLRSAFEMGLMSWHPMTVTYEQFANEMKRLFERSAHFKDDHVLVAGSYLRDYLKVDKSMNELLDLDRVLMLKYPEDPRVLLQHADSLFVKGEKDQAVSLIGRATASDAELAGYAKQSFDRYLGGTERSSLSDTTIPLAEEIGLDDVVIIDPDQSVHVTLKSCLHQLGVKTIWSYSDAEEAWGAIVKNRRVGMVIQEWKLPRLPSHVFVQRLRTGGYELLPVIIYSSVAKSADKASMREFGIAEVIEKPKSIQDLSLLLRQIMHREFVAMDCATIERKFRQNLIAGNIDEAKRLFDVMDTRPDATDLTKTVMRAELQFYTGQLAEAKQTAIGAIKTAGESVVLFNLLGKILTELREFELAAKFLQRADALAPNNLERLCKMAEVHLEKGDLPSAEKFVGKAEVVDKSSPLVTQTQAKVAVTQGQSDTAKKLIEKMGSTRELVAYLNNRAVQLAKDDKLDQGMDLYKRALESLPNGFEDLKAIIRYNMGLACAKKGDMERADQYLGMAASARKSPVFDKARSLKVRVRDSVDRGTKLEIRSGNGTGPGKEAGISVEEEKIQTKDIKSKRRELPSAGDVKMGELCLYLVYQNPNELPDNVKKLVANKAKIVEKAIELRAATVVGVSAATTAANAAAAAAAPGTPPANRKTA